MRRILFALIAALFLIPLGCYAQTGKLVYDKYGNVLRYVGETKNYYITDSQDGRIKVLKKESRVVTLSAAKGQGVIYPRESGPKYMRKSPSYSAKVTAIVGFHDGDLPEPMPCLGVSKDWFITKSRAGRIGYVPKKLFEWHPTEVY